jgi:hypothetical protein
MTRRVQKLRAKEIQEKAWETERDRWFIHERPMKKSTNTWKEKRIEKEEKGEEYLQDKKDPPCAEINMVFEMPKVLNLPEDTAARLDLGGRKSHFLEA